MFRSGQLYSYGIAYFGPLARDGVWHEALVGQLTKNIIPQNPGLAWFSLTNYHYFYDLLVSIIHRLGIPTSFLIYRFFPVILSVALGIGTYKLTQILFKDRFVSYISVFFAFFASSFGWIVSLVKHEQIGGESAFWANQPVSMNLNPPYAISLVIIIFSILLIDSYIKKGGLIKAIAIIALSGTLIGFKVYAGVILLGGLFVLMVKRLVIDKDKKLIPIFIFSSLITLVIFFTQDRLSIRLLEFNPLWLVNTMIDAGDRVGIPDFTAKRFAYLAENKWLHLFAVESISFLIFFIGNLGTRIVGFWKFEKKNVSKDLFVFIFSMMAVSIVPPLIFTQKGNPWNIVQFFYYFLYFAGFFAAASVRKLPVWMAILIILITPISSVATFRNGFYPNPPAYLPVAEYNGLKFLSTETDGIILKRPFEQKDRSRFKDPYPMSVYADNAYVSAHSGKSVFIEDVEQQIVLNTDYKGRLTDAGRFFVEKDLTWSKTFLKVNNIAYIYLPKIYALPMAEEEYPMKKIFENKDVNIYKVEDDHISSR